MSAPDGGPAFPFAYPAATDAAVYGMSLRDYFAAKVLQGEISASERGFNVDWTGGSVATIAYAIADAMLKERAK